MIRAQIENLYVDAMVLADEAYAAFAGGSPSADTRYVHPADSIERVALVCEQLKTSTRLMHIIAWILHHRARLAREAGVRVNDPVANLDDVAPNDPEICERLAPATRQIVRGSEALLERVRRLDSEMRGFMAHTPVQALLSRLDRSI